MNQQSKLAVTLAIFFLVSGPVVAAAVSPVPTVPIAKLLAGPGLPAADIVRVSVAPSVTMVAVLVLVTVTVSEL